LLGQKWRIVGQPLYNIISKLDRGKDGRFVFVDISKAFDMVLYKAF
jgi:hypothetical protein